MPGTTEFSEINYCGSFNTFESLKYPLMPEYAFIGRSNVGKSSLINYLLNKNNVAFTSSTPGKTTSLNQYMIGDQWLIVDLPGYGYARRSKADRKEWEKLIYKYLRSRNNLVMALQLIDSSIEPKKVDIEFAVWLGANEVPFAQVFTKTDKENDQIIKKNIENFHNEMERQWESLPPYYVTSSILKSGREQLLSDILTFNKEFYKAIKNLEIKNKLLGI